VEYIHKDKAQKIYKDIEKQFIIFFKEMPLDKLKADKLQRNRSRQRRRGKNKDQVCCAISETQTVCCSPVI
jgi:hypothetical protein